MDDIRVLIIRWFYDYMLIKNSLNYGETFICQKINEMLINFVKCNKEVGFWQISKEKLMVHLSSLLKSVP